jgi:hypothetical protein
MTDLAKTTSPFLNFGLDNFSVDVDDWPKPVQAAAAINNKIGDPHFTIFIYSS